MFRLTYGHVPVLSDLSPGPLDLWAFSGKTAADKSRLMDMGLLPWWTADSWRIAFWRPLAAVTHWMDWHLFGPHPFPMHVHNLLWYAALAAAVTLFYRRFLTSRFTAGLAGFLYAIDAAHGMPAGWLSNRNAVLSAFFSVLVILTYDAWRRYRWKPGYLLSLLLTGLALLSGESDIAVGGYLAAYMFFMDDRRPLQRLVPLLPFGLLVVAWRVVYTALGYGVVGSEIYVDPGTHPVGFLVRTALHLPVLLFGQFAAGEVIAWNYFPFPIKVSAWVAAVAFLALVLYALWPMLRRERVARFLLAGAILSTVPTCAALPQARLLLFTGVGAMGLVALFITAVFAEPEETRSLRRRVSRGMAWTWIVLHIFVSLIAMPIASCSMYFADAAVRHEMAQVPKTNANGGGTFIIMNAAADVWGPMFLASHIESGEPMPQFTRQLTAGVKRLEVERSSVNSLILRWEEPLIGTPWTPVFRNPLLDPLRPGQRIEVPGLEITITSIDSDSSRGEAVFTFAKRLDDPSYQWIAYQGDACVPFAPPAPGNTVFLTTPSLLDMVKARLLDARMSNE